MFASTEGKRGQFYKRRIPLKILINVRDIYEYERSIELNVKYFKGNITCIKI